MSPQPTPVVPAMSVSAPTPPPLSARDVTVTRTPQTTELRGAPGAEASAGIVVRIFAIDVPGTSAETTSRHDGSFLASLASPSTREVHFDLEQSGSVWTGDFETRADGTLSRLASPRCLTSNLTSAILIGQGPASETATYRVKLTEICGHKDAIHVALHTGARFRLEDAPTTMGAHETVTLSVVYSAGDTRTEDVDLLVVTDSSPGAMVVSLHAVTL